MESNHQNSIKSLSEKFGIKAGHQIHILNDPGILVALISPLPENVKIVKTSKNKVDIVISFFAVKKEL